MADRIARYIGNDLTVEHDLIINGEVAGGSSSSSSGNYSNAKDDFNVSIIVGTKTITLSQLPFTIDIKNIIGGSAKVTGLSGNTYTTEILSVDAIDLIGDNITFNGFARDFSTNDEVTLTLSGPDKSYDQDLNTTLTQEQSPIYSYYSDSVVIVSDTNLAVNNYFSSIPWGNYNHGYISLIATDPSNCTVKLYAEMVPDSVVPATGGTPGTTWLDITNDVISVDTIDTSTIKFMSIFDRSFRPDNLLLEYEFSGAVNAIDAYVKKWY